jgi:uncharacterized protein (DUF952 family)
MNVILHITTKNDWNTASLDGSYNPASLDNEGFIHCSTIEQTIETANQYFKNQRDLVILCIDKNNLDVELKYEPPAENQIQDTRSSALFPHLYGPLKVSSVVKVVDLVPNIDGEFILPEEINEMI